MARVSVPVADSPPWLAGVNLTAALGDNSNLNDVDLSSTPLIVLAMNYHTSPITMTIQVPAINETFGIAQSIDWTLPAATAGIAQPRLTVVTNQNVAQAGRKLHIDIVDANANLVRLYAAIYRPTTP